MQIQSAGKAPSRARLLLSFLRLGSAAFGGPAMVACIRGGIALCRMVPGATAMQSAAFVALVLKVEIYRVLIAGIIVIIIFI